MNKFGCPQSFSNMHTEVGYLARMRLTQHRICRRNIHVVSEKSFPNVLSMLISMPFLIKSSKEGKSNVSRSHFHADQLGCTYGLIGNMRRNNSGLHHPKKKSFGFTDSGNLSMNLNMSVVLCYFKMVCRHILAT